MHLAIITKEWPPQIYGGAGVHVFQLTQALRTVSGTTVDVHCFGGERSDGAYGYDIPIGFESANPALQALAIDIAIADRLSSVDLVHSHTWYANMAGHMASMMHGIPHVVSAHSLEPLRPWKAEQLGGGYRISSWAEKTAYESAAAIIAVSDGMRSDVMKAYPSINPEKIVTIRNGVDTEKFKPHHAPEVLDKYGVLGRYALFVGRITRQKGLAHLLRAWQQVPHEYTLVLAAGSPDEPTIGHEVEDLVKSMQNAGRKIIWIKEMLPHDELTAMLTGADLFLCPSIYEPLGIVNLEAMACETAVLASRVGGIPEVVVDGITGKLIPYDERNATKFESDLATGITELLANPDRLREMGAAGRTRAIKDFGWSAIAQATLALYAQILAAR